MSWVIRGSKVSGAAKSDGETEEGGGQWGRGTPGATGQGRVSGEGRKPTLRLELPHRGEDSGRKGAGNTDRGQGCEVSNTANMKEDET